jgi:hypothetical protein
VERLATAEQLQALGFEVLAPAGRRFIQRARLTAGPETQDRLAATIGELRDQLDDDVNELYRAP